MAFLIDQLNNSGLFAQSAYSACIATKDSDGNDITATYLTGVDLTPYQTTAGMTAYATTGDVANKLDTTAFSDVSGTFLTAHQSLDGYATTAWVDSQGYLTAHQPISADEWNDVYNTVNVYSGSWTGSETSPTASVDSYGSIDIVSSNNTVYFDVNGTWFNDAVNSAVDVPTGVMVESACEYNAVNEISGYNGSAIAQYGAEKQWLVHDDTLVHAANSAQYALGCNISALQRLMGIDETVLYSAAPASSTPVTTVFNLNEDARNFNKLKIVINPWQQNGYSVMQRPAQEFIWDISYIPLSNMIYAHAPCWSIAGGQLNYEVWYLSGSRDTTTAFSMLNGIKAVNGTYSTATTMDGSILKIVGIGRKS